MATGIITGGGIGRSISTITASASYNRSKHPIKIPMGTHTSAAKRYPAAARFRLARIGRGIWPDHTSEPNDGRILLSGGTMSGLTRPACAMHS